jgi:hypothetical protein
MSEKENQHYVPKFYLRKFSFEENNRQIGLLNLDREFYYPTANIKNQASKSFFYGKDLLVENALRSLESLYSIIIDRICQNEKLPKKTTFDYYVLIQFIVLTGLRNPVASETTQESFDKFILLLRSRAKMPNDFNAMRLTQEDLKFFVFGNLSMITEMCMDLEYKIIKNLTSIPFITSDNPVIKYNQFLEKRKVHGSVTGYASLGLQFSNCYKNVFFNHLTPRQYLLDLLKVSKRFPNANIGMAEEHLLANRNGTILKNQSISVMYRTDCKTKLKLSFIKETRQTKLLLLDNRAMHLRKRANYIRNKYNT